MSQLPKKAHWPPLYIYLQTAIFAVVVWYMTHARYQDDAFISLTYARNLLSGHGLVWNPGEHVEGYSNFLFIMLSAGLGWLGVDLVWASTLINFASYFILLGVLYAFTRHHYRTHCAQTPFAYAHSINNALCVALVASSVIMLTWCFGGLEAMLFAMLLTTAVCMVLRWLDTGISHRAIFLAGMLFALAAMTRLEGLMMWGLTGLFLGVLWLLKRCPERIDLKKLLLLAAGFLIIFAPYMEWRFTTFGDVLPNTYYAKVFGIPSDILFFQGFFYFVQFLIMPPMLPLFGLALLYMARKHKALPYTVLYLFVLIAAFCIHVVKSGGDHMYYLRFFVPVVPLVALLIFYANNIIIPHNEKRFRDICGALIVLLVFQFGMVRTDENLSAGAASGKAVTEYVNTHWPKGSLIAINPAGALPYYSPDYYYLDMMGLMDRTISHRSFLDADPKILTHLRGKAPGHHKGDGAYVFSRKPDYIIFGNAAWGTEQPVMLSDIELFAMEKFHEDYEKIEVYVSPPAYMLESLSYLAEHNQTAYESSPNQAEFVRGPVMNEEGKLRFIYWKRKSTTPAGVAL